MKTIRRLSGLVVVALSACLLTACGGGETPEAKAPSSPPENTTPPPPPAGGTSSQSGAGAAAQPSEAAPAEPVKEALAPTPKPLRDRFLGRWQGSLTGDRRTAAEEAARKKAGKDEKKYADLMKQAEADAAKIVREFSGDVEAAYEGNKLVYRITYSVVKEEGNTMIVKKSGKDEVSKKDIQGEYTIVFKDDNTIEVRDPDVKDPKKAQVLLLTRDMAKLQPVGGPAAGGAATTGGNAGGTTAAGASGAATGTGAATGAGTSNSAGGATSGTKPAGGTR